MIVGGSMSPAASKWKVPKRPSVTRLAFSRSSTEARVPSEWAIAVSTSSAAWALSSTPACGLRSWPVSAVKARAAAVRGRAARGASVVAT